LATLSTYQDVAQKCEVEIQNRLAKLSKEYANELNSLADTFRSRGDLEKTLEVNNEKKRFAAEGTLQERNVVEVPTQLRELQQKYLAEPIKVTEQIAQSYVGELEEIKRKLTIDDKLDEAQAAQKEIDKIQKKYSVVNPTRGSELRKEQLPKHVAMNRDLSIPLIVEGQRVGLTGLRRGQAYKLVKVDGSQVTIRVADSDVVVPVEATDLLRRIEQIQKGVKEGDIEAGEVEGKTAAAMIGAWRDDDGRASYVFRGNHTVTISIPGRNLKIDGTWTVEGDSVLVRYNDGCWERYNGPIRAEGTPNMNCNDARGFVRKVTQ
jgi:hypothetical protein